MESKTVTLLMRMVGEAAKKINIVSNASARLLPPGYMMITCYSTASGPLRRAERPLSEHRRLRDRNGCFAAGSSLEYRTYPSDHPGGSPLSCKIGRGCSTVAQSEAAKCGSDRGARSRTRIRILQRPTPPRARPWSTVRGEIADECRAPKSP